MNNLIRDIIKELDIIDFKIDQYNIYHVFFSDMNEQIHRYFLSGNEFQKWCFDELKTFVINLSKDENITILDQHKSKFNFTLDLNSLYPA